ncbi:hypothetical protein LXL04_033184 [Taraxacum kok-saghyz]
MDNQEMRLTNYTNVLDFEVKIHTVLDHCNEQSEKGEYKRPPYLVSLKTPPEFLLCLLNLGMKWRGRCFLSKPFVTIDTEKAKGTGKTFLYRALLAKVRSEGHYALATATSGIAASLLPGVGLAIEVILWKARNEAIFQKAKPSVANIADNILSLVFSWVSNRGNTAETEEVDKKQRTDCKVQGAKGGHQIKPNISFFTAQCLPYHVANISAPINITKVATQMLIGNHN